MLPQKKIENKLNRLLNGLGMGRFCRKWDNFYGYPTVVMKGYSGKLLPPRALIKPEGVVPSNSVKIR